MALVLAAGDADDVASLDFCNLADNRADRTGRSRDHDSLALLRLADVEQAEIGGEASDALDRAQMGHRLQLRHLGERLLRYPGIVLAPGIAQHAVALRKPR